MDRGAEGAPAVSGAEAMGVEETGHAIQPLPPADAHPHHQQPHEHELHLQSVTADTSSSLEGSCVGDGAGEGAEAPSSMELLDDAAPPPLDGHANGLPVGVPRTDGLHDDANDDANDGDELRVVAVQPAGESDAEEGEVERCEVKEETPEGGGQGGGHHQLVPMVPMADGGSHVPNHVPMGLPPAESGGGMEPSEELRVEDTTPIDRLGAGELSPDLMQQMQMKAAAQAAAALGLSPEAALAAVNTVLPPAAEVDPPPPSATPPPPMLSPPPTEGGGGAAPPGGMAVDGMLPVVPFPHAQNVQMQLDDEGGGESDFTCTVCRKVFKREMNLVFHMTTHRPKQAKPECDDASIEPVTCQDCGKTFGTKYQAKKHYLRRHFQGERPFGCPKCAKRFVVREDLTMHVKSCGNVYACSCGIRLCSLGALKRHCKHFAHEPISLAPQSDAGGQPALAHRPELMYSHPIGGGDSPRMLSNYAQARPLGSDAVSLDPQELAALGPHVAHLLAKRHASEQARAANGGYGSSFGAPSARSSLPAPLPPNLPEHLQQLMYREHAYSNGLGRDVGGGASERPQQQNELPSYLTNALLQQGGGLAGLSGGSLAGLGGSLGGNFRDASGGNFRDASGGNFREASGAPFSDGLGGGLNGLGALSGAPGGGGNPFGGGVHGRAYGLGEAHPGGGGRRNALDLMAGAAAAGAAARPTDEAEASSFAANLAFLSQSTLVRQPNGGGEG